LEQSKSNKTFDVPDLSDLSKKIPQGFSATQQRTFQTTITSLLSNPENLSQKIDTYIKNNPENENQVVFSLIPALYSCLWSLEEATRYVDLISASSFKLQKSLTRLLLVHPSFFVFLSSIQSDAVKIITSEHYELKDIFNLFLSRTFLFPTSI